MPKNVFVLGLDGLNRRWMQSLPEASDYRFHQLLTIDELQKGETIPAEQLLRKAHTQLSAFDGRIDAIISFWDFPASLMAPILRRTFGARGPSVENVFTCEHKYWCRLEQSRSIREYPAFNLVNPFDDQVLDKIELDFPFWLKPVKAFLAQLAYVIKSEDDLKRDIAVIRRKLPRLGDPFTQLLKHVTLPPQLQGVDGNYCIAEQVIRGNQCTLEGYVYRGEPAWYGVVDSHRYPGVSVFTRLEYPSMLPQSVQQRMGDVMARFMRHIDFDDGPFNAEFFWDQDTDDLRLLEINTRISQSHAYIFQQVDGVSNHRVPLHLAVGQRPDMPHREGPHGSAAKFMHRYFRDGVVRRVPSPQDVARVEDRFPGSIVDITVQPGDRLRDLVSQDAYSYLLMEVFMGAADQRALLEQYEQCLAMLPFEIEDVQW